MGCFDKLRERGKQQRMPRSPDSPRYRITVAVLLSAIVVCQFIGKGEPFVQRVPLRTLANPLADWAGDEIPLEDQTVKAIGVTDYINRLYGSHGQPPIQLYIGYYASQRTGDTIHSPKNCLPGTGWDPIYSGSATISLPAGRNIIVNEYVIQQDQNKQMVFYWYQGRGRVIASEYWSKFWMVADALSRNRTDGALIRVNTSMDDGDAEARSRLTNFTQVLFPALDNLIPQ